MIADKVKITSLPAGQLTADQIHQWSALQQADPAVDSPYFRPEFALAVADVCENVEVAVFEQGGETVGFLPFQRVRGRRAVPVGQTMSNFQGAILAEQVSFSAQEFLKGCGLVKWDFDHLLAQQPAFAEFQSFRCDSPYLNLTGGYDAYIAERYQAGRKKFFKGAERAAKQLERELGPLRLEFPARDPQAFETLIRWKREQYQRTRVGDTFSRPWARPLLERIAEQQSLDFSGSLAALYAGDRLVSAHFGMQAGAVLHYWYPAYDPTVPSRFSPGHTLILEIAKQAGELGIQRIDLGKGDEAYKRYLASGATCIAEGSVDQRFLPRLLKNRWIRTRERIRESRLRTHARTAKRLVRPMFDRLKYGTNAAISASHREPSLSHCSVTVPDTGKSV